jgi:hypothetical protein
MTPHMDAARAERDDLARQLAEQIDSADGLMAHIRGQATTITVQAQQIETLTAQRGRLLAACETYKATEDYQAGIPIWEFTAEQRDELRRRRYETYDVIMAAIANTKGNDNK